MYSVNELLPPKGPLAPALLNATVKLTASPPGIDNSINASLNECAEVGVSGLDPSIILEFSSIVDGESVVRTNVMPSTVSFVVLLAIKRVNMLYS